MADSIATVVNWYGPYTAEGGVDVIKVANKAAVSDWGTGLYTAIGTGEIEKASKMGPRKLLYMGVGAPLHARLTKQHHKLSKLQIGALWLGEVGVPGVPGRKRKRINVHLDMVEWASAFFLELPFNVKKRANPPDTSCVVTNRWFSTDYETSVEKPNRAWPDIIEYDYQKALANLVWFAPKPVIKSLPVDKVKRARSTRSPLVDDEV